VHYGFAERPDVSADLGELATAPVLLVASGMKSFLDVNATAEVLETLSIPVLGWRMDTIPLYYVAQGGPPVSARVESASDVAATAWHHWNTLRRRSGIVLGQPPRADVPDVQEFIADGLERARKDGVTGPAVTSYVLGHVHRASGGRTKEATRMLILDNAALAGEIARSYEQFDTRMTAEGLVQHGAGQ
jgi:pseudouridine-5'-phosphate glycosidase